MNALRQTTTGMLVALAAVLLISACATREDRPPVLEINPPQPEPAQVGEDYSAQLSVQGQQQPLRKVEIVSGELPPRLQLEWNQGEGDLLVRGTPSQAGQWDFELLVSTIAPEGHGQELTRRMSLLVEP